ncbi:MAG: hypothetical protein AABY10_00050 [Nanoarchaeota archaeon]
MKIQEALKELRSLEKKKFDQSIDLIVNLKKIDPKRDQVNTVVTLPHKFKEKKVCGFLTKKSTLVETITEPEFQRYKDKKELKNLVKRYDYFIASAPLMGKVATVFGKILGPAGKMPSPQLGVIMHEDDKNIKESLDKISKSLKIRLKEASLKLIVGKETSKDADIEENILAVYKAIENALPKKRENVRNVMIKLTMSKPIKIEVI